MNTAPQTFNLEISTSAIREFLEELLSGEPVERTVKLTNDEIAGLGLPGVGA